MVLIKDSCYCSGSGIAKKCAAKITKQACSISLTIACACFGSFNRRKLSTTGSSMSKY